MLPRSEGAHHSSPDDALDLISILVARRQDDQLWETFLQTAPILSTAQHASLIALHDQLATDGNAHSWQLAAIRVWVRRLIESVPSRESAALGRLALEKLHRQQPTENAAQSFHMTAAELIIQHSSTWFQAAADSVDALLKVIEQLPPEAQVANAQVIRYLLDIAVDANIATCRLDSAETLLDARGFDSRLAVDDEASTRAFLHAMRGDVTVARDLTQVAPQPTSWFTRQSSGPSSARGQIALAAVTLESGRPDEALSILRQLEPHHSCFIEWPFAAIVTARAFTSVDPIAGSEHLQRLLQRNRALPTSKRLLHLLKSALVDLALAADDVPTARRMLSEIDSEDHALRISAARLALVTGDSSSVRDLRDLVASPEIWPRLRSQALLLLAVHLKRSGHGSEAGDTLRRAIAITSELNISVVHALVPRHELEQIARSAAVELPAGVPSAGRIDTVLMHVHLTERESALLSRLDSTSTLASIARDEFVSLSTIKSQLRSLYRKLGVTSRDEAVIVAVRRGLMLSRDV